MADPWQTAYDFAVQVARAAGAVRKKNEPRPTSPTLTPEPRANALLFVQVIRKAGEEEIKIQTKSSAVDLVTKTDERVEKIIIGSLKEQFGDGTHWSVSHTHRRMSMFVAFIDICHRFFRAAVSLEKSPSLRGRRVS